MNNQSLSKQTHLLKVKQYFIFNRSIFLSKSNLIYIIHTHPDSHNLNNSQCRIFCSYRLFLKSNLYFIHIQDNFVNLNIVNIPRVSRVRKYRYWESNWEIKNIFHRNLGLYNPNNPQSSRLHNFYSARKSYHLHYSQSMSKNWNSLGSHQ